VAREKGEERQGNVQWNIGGNKGVRKEKHIREGGKGLTKRAKNRKPSVNQQRERKGEGSTEKRKEMKVKTENETVGGRTQQRG